MGDLSSHSAAKAQEIRLSREFLEVSTLKRHIKHRIDKGLGWPTVILNAKSQRQFRPDIPGSISLFYNLRGRSICRLGQKDFMIGGKSYFLSNAGQEYTLIIDEAQQAETFNIHFGKRLLEDFFSSIQQGQNQFLEDPKDLFFGPSNFHNHVHPSTSEFERLIVAIQNCMDEDHLILEELLIDLLDFLMDRHLQVSTMLGSGISLRKATMKEALDRLGRVSDFIHSFFHLDIQLLDLAEVAMMSKFQLLRYFKEAYKESPYQMVLRLRIQKAKEIMKREELPLGVMALKLGFGNPGQFSRHFRKITGHSPTEFKKIG